MIAGGIDGCKYGWIMATHKAGEYGITIHKSFAALMESNSNLGRVLIDIPVGLSTANYPRTIEKAMRSELGQRSSTVFNAPCRLAVYEKDNEKARLLNQQVENKSLSIQSLQIRNKIREVDEFLSRGKTSAEIIESHPELCFKYLNGGVVLSKKSRPEGIAQRLEILSKYEDGVMEIYDRAVKQYKRKEAKRDDIIDAICLCLVNKLGEGNRLKYLADENSISENGIKIKIGYYKGENHW